MTQERVPVNPSTAARIGRAIPVSELSNPTVCAALHAWQEKAGERPFPSKSEMVPKAVAPFLRSVMLIELLPDDDFQFRVVGDTAVVAYGYSFQGMNRGQLNTMEPGFGDVIDKVCRSIRTRHQPIGVRGVVMRAESSADEHEGIFLPLGEEEVVSHVLFVGSYRGLDASELVKLES